MLTQKKFKMLLILDSFDKPPYSLRSLPPQNNY
jgi:hypothetical protein